MKQGGNHSGGFTRPSPGTAGFTIVETMIVLAVSTSLAASALLLVGGRQNKTLFQTSINSVQQQIQQIINETQSGYYPNNSDIACTGNQTPSWIANHSLQALYPSGVPAVTTGASGQGTNDSCIFLGKAIRFGRFDSAGSYTVYPLIGNRLNTAGQQVTSFLDSGVTPLAPGEATNPDFPTQYATTTTLGGGLTLAGVSYDGTFSSDYDAAHPIIVAFAVVTALSNYSYGDDGLNPGTQQFSLYTFNSLNGLDPVKWKTDVTNPAQAVDAMNEDRLTATPSKGLGLCFASGTTNQSGLITIGAAAATGAGGLGVSLQIFNTADCT